MTINSNDWIEENGRLARVLVLIAEERKQLAKIAEQSKADLSNTREHFWRWEEIKLNPEETLETAASLMQQKNEIAEKERNYRHALKTLQKMERMVSSPYFGRIDFIEQGYHDTERIYIGILSLINDKTGEHLIYDWRAPISEMLYDYQVGPADFAAPDCVISGEITLKRQYVIRDSHLTYMFDTGIQIGDEVLQHMLGKSTDDRMKSIVTTIQQEQNRIIRDDKIKALIVQGAAGSGKTSVALQRVAYLLYKFRNSLTEDSMILFSPNAMFNDYVSSVLPELGENNMKQTTFQEYMEDRLGDAYILEDSYDQLEYTLTAEQNPEYAARISGIEYKASIDFLTIIKRYADLLKYDEIIFQDLCINDKILITGDALRTAFYADKQLLSMGNRMDEFVEWILKELDVHEINEAKIIFRKLLKRPNYNGTEKELHKLSVEIAKKQLSELKQSVQRLQFVAVSEMYNRLYEDEALFSKLAGDTEVPSQWDKVREISLDQLRQLRIPYEDTAPLLYFKGLVEGTPALRDIRHVVVDEAQDYSPFQFELLKDRFPYARFTILGDLNQAVYAHSKLPNYDPVISLFGAENTGLIRLSKSYRSSSEIVDFTRAMLPQGESIEAFSRSGDKPRIEHVVCGAGQEYAQESAAKIAETIAGMQLLGAASVAVICKSAQESQEAYEALFKVQSGEIHLVTKKTKSFISGIQVIPAYLAKGLEFDGVIIYNASMGRYHRESERKLLYTACTRAKNQLTILYCVEITPFISALSNELYHLAD